MELGDTGLLQRCSIAGTLDLYLSLSISNSAISLTHWCYHSRQVTTLPHYTTHGPGSHPWQSLWRRLPFTTPCDHIDRLKFPADISCVLVHCLDGDVHLSFPHVKTLFLAFIVKVWCTPDYSIVLRVLHIQYIIPRVHTSPPDLPSVFASLLVEGRRLFPTPFQPLSGLHCRYSFL